MHWKQTFLTPGDGFSRRVTAGVSYVRRQSGDSVIFGVERTRAYVPTCARLISLQGLFAMFGEVLRGLYAGCTRYGLIPGLGRWADVTRGGCRWTQEAGSCDAQPQPSYQHERLHRPVLPTKLQSIA